MAPKRVDNSVIEQSRVDPAGKNSNNKGATIASVGAFKREAKGARAVTRDSSGNAADEAHVSSKVALSKAKRNSQPRSAFSSTKSVDSTPLPAKRAKPKEEPSFKNSERPEKSLAKRPRKPSNKEANDQRKSAGDIGDAAQRASNDLDCQKKVISYEKKGNIKIASWNINGIRAWLPKGGIDYLKQERPDVLCVQETKCANDKLPEEISTIDGYKSYFLSGDKDGYSGVGVFTCVEPIDVKFGIGIREHDAEGRVITLEFEDYFIVNAYVPNAGRGLVRLDYRMNWDKDFRSYLCRLKESKPVILTGDLNVAHEEIDLANPKGNKRNAGFTQEERDGMSVLLSQGFVDSFRRLYPDRSKAYTFWTYMMQARAKNVGWRLDYFIVSEDLMDRVVDNEIRDKVMGSDHCPIVLHLK